MPLVLTPQTMLSYLAPQRHNPTGRIIEISQLFLHFLFLILSVSSTISTFTLKLHNHPILCTNLPDLTLAPSPSAGPAASRFFDCVFPVSPAVSTRIGSVPR